MVLRWQTPRGVLGLAHSLIDGNATCTAVVSALRRRHEEPLGDSTSINLLRGVHRTGGTWLVLRTRRCR
ncbi:hypothetical protein GCM10010245_79590 [Streptomyces spectabilis]|nr:hypothetical protein GCM10010245_79590 [Streptomyces spectabilis]